MASTSFGVLITGDASGAVKAIDLTSDELGKLEGATEKATRKVKGETDKATSSFGDLAKSAAKMGAVVAAAGAAIAGLAFRKIIQESSESEFAIAQLNATLAATQGASGKTSQELIATADALQKVTTFSDESVLGVQSLIANFKNIKGDTFDRATVAVLDMATALKQDAPSAAKILGRALDDPINGLSKLSRAGITFTDSQKEAITALVEMGDKAGAQAIILEQLEGRFKGSAEAARDTLGGALKGLENNFGELFEASDSTSSAMIGNINSLADALAQPHIKESIDSIAAALVNAAEKSLQFVAAMNWAFGTGGKRNLVDISDEITAVEEQLTKLEAAGNVRGRAEQITALKKQLSELTKEYDKQVASINGAAKSADNQSKSVAKATVATSANTKATNDNVNAGLKSAATMKTEAAAAETAAKADAKRAAEKEKARGAIAKLVAEEVKTTQATEDYIESLKFETTQLGLSERQQFINNKVKQAGVNVTEAQIDAIKREAAALYDTTQAVQTASQAQEEAARATEQAWSDARATLSNFFFEMARDGKSAFDTLVDGFKAMLNKLAAEAAANVVLVGIRAVFPGAAGLIGSLSSGTAAAGTSSISGGSTLLSGGISGLTNGITAGGQALYESIGNLASNAGFTGIGDKFYNKGLNTSLTSMGLDLGGGILGGFAGNKVFGETSGIGSSVGAIAGSALIPIPGLGAAIGSFIGSGLEKAAQKLFGQKNDGNNRGMADFNLATGDINARGVGKSFDQGSVDAAEQLSMTLKDFAKSIGGSDLAANITVSGKQGIQYGGQTFGQDSEAFFQKAFKDVVSAATDLSEDLKPVIIGFDGTAEEIGTFAATLKALDKETGGIRAEVLGLIDDFEGTAQEAIAFATVIASLDKEVEGIKPHVLDLIGSFKGTGEELVRFTAAIISLDQQSGINTVTQAIKDFTKVVPSASVAYQENTADIMAQIAAFDGSADAADKLNKSLIENKTAAYDFAMAIQSIGKSISESAIGQATDIRESVMTPEQLRAKRTKERDTLITELPTLTDPADVDRAAKRILELNKQIFDSLDEAAKKARAEEFAGVAIDTNATAQDILGKALTGIETTQTSINTSLSATLTTFNSASKLQQSAADTQVTASQTQAEAAKTSLDAATKALEAANKLTAAVQVASNRVTLGGEAV